MIFLFRKDTSGDLFSESEPEHEPCTGESEWERKPDAGQPPIEDEAKEVSCRKRDDEVGDEGNVHHWLNISDAAEGIRIGALHPIAELVDDERKDEARHHERHFIVVREPSAYFMTKEEEGDGNADGEHQDDVEACIGRMQDTGFIVLSMEIADSDGNGCGHTIINHIS